MVVGVNDRVWTCEEIAALLDSAATTTRGR
jgi:hypothetical protein